jgi:hypothetical protein
VRIKQPDSDNARMLVPKLVCEVACASGFASYMDGDVLWDTRSYVRKARLNSITLEKGNLGTHMRAELNRACLDQDKQRVTHRNDRNSL